MNTNNSEKPEMFRHVMKWLTIGWTVFCLLGIGGCSVIDLVAAAQTTPVNGDTDAMGAAVIVTMLFTIILWFGVWILGAIPCAVLWLVGKQKQ